MANFYLRIIINLIVKIIVHSENWLELLLTSYKLQHHFLFIYLIELFSVHLKHTVTGRDKRVQMQ